MSREIKRNGGRDGTARQLPTSARGIGRLRPKRCKLARHEEFGSWSLPSSHDNWSPEQIAGWLKHTYPEDEAYQVSHETIYRSLFIQARGVLKKELMEHLRTHRAIRRSRHATAKADMRGRSPDTVSISERPASVEDRAVPGHWEGDCCAGRRTATSSRWSSGTRVT